MKRQRAFIFDMDGVIINSETMWENSEKSFLTEMMGKEVYQKIKDQILGSTVDMVYDLARQNGFSLDKRLFFQLYDQQARDVYARAKLTDNIEKFISLLVSMNFRIGLVSASRSFWIELVLNKLKKRNIFSYVLSLSERNDLSSKPNPDGYIEVMKKLQSVPTSTIILEDSQKGIMAAKNSGALSICLLEHLPVGYVVEGADISVRTVTDLLQLFKMITL